MNFILQFKGLQFVTLGILNCMVGAASYYECVAVDYAGDRWPALPDGRGNRLYLNDCHMVGPGALPGFYTDMILFLVQGMTVWLAMGLLPGTIKKGLRKLAAGSAPRHFQPSSPSLLEQVETAIPVVGFGRKPVYGGMGGKLRQMIFFDAFVLLLLCGVTTLLLFTRPYDVLEAGAFSRHEWLFKQDVFWLKTIYGLASLPFVVFLIPVVSNVLLHVRPTGYNRAGVCVPLQTDDGGAVPEALQGLPSLDEVVRRGEAAANSASGAIAALRAGGTGSNQVGQDDSVPPVGLAWPPNAANVEQQLQVVVHAARS